MPYALVMRPVLRSRPLIGRYRRMADIAEPVVDSLLSRMTQLGHWMNLSRAKVAKLHRREAID